MLQSSPAGTRLRAARHRREPRRVRARRNPRGGCATILWVGASLLIATSAGCSSQAPVDKAADQIDISAAKAPPPPPARGGQAATATPARSTWKERQKAAAAKSLVTATPVASIGAPVTEDDVRKVAAEIEQAVKAGDPNRLSGMFDYAAIIESAYAGLDVPANARADGERSLSTSLASPGGQLAELVRAGTGTNAYQLLRVAARRDCPVARFRLNSKSGGLNYHDLMLARRADGNVRIVDFYNFMSGETFADSVRQLVVAALASQPKGFFGQVSAKEREFLEAAPHMKLIAEGRAKRNYHQVLSAISALPASVRQMKPVMLLQIQALGETKKTDELVAVTNEYRRLFPDDPSCDIISMDAELFQKNYEAVLVSLDRLDKAVGGDPGLNTLRAFMLVFMKKPEQAAAAALKSVEYNPADIDAHKVLAVIAAEAKDYDKVAARLDEMKEKCGYDVKEVGSDSRFLPFGMSDIGKAWLRKHGLLPPGR